MRYSRGGIGVARLRSFLSSCRVNIVREKKKRKKKKEKKRKKKRKKKKKKKKKKKEEKKEKKKTLVSLDIANNHIIRYFVLFFRIHRFAANFDRIEHD